VRIWGIDPGRTIGIAALTDPTPYSPIGWETDDPIGLVKVALAATPDVIVIERFTSGGLISGDGAHTIAVFGYLAMRFREAGYVVVEQMPQMRKSALAEAQKWFPTHAERHIADALAHALSYNRRRKRGNP
jgi:hypothetical protein